MEHKFVIVRTRKGNVVNCFSFMTSKYNGGNVLPTFIKPNKVADEIELKTFVGGLLSVTLTTHKNNGDKDYDVIEEVMFEKGLVTKIEIYTEYDCCRSPNNQSSSGVNNGSR